MSRFCAAGIRAGGAVAVTVTAPRHGECDHLTVAQQSSKDIVLHVGTHKTGTTSIQRFLGHNRALLHQHDADFFRGRFMGANHVELHIAAMRADRMSPVKCNLRLTPTDEFVHETAEAVRAFIERSPSRTLIFSAEGLSYLRFAGEMEVLKSILGQNPTKIVIALRDKADFLRSYTRQLQKQGFATSSEQGSFAYVEDDSWLVDYDALVDAYSAAFGSENVIVMNYEDELRKHTSIIPPFLRAAGVAGIESGFESYWLNRT